MKLLIIALSLATLFLTGCGKETINENIEPNLIVGKSLETLALNDQFGKRLPIQPETKKVIFAFEQDSAHAVNEYLATKNSTYLEDNNAFFAADVSAAPSLVRKMFIMPALKDFEHSVLIFENESIAAPFRLGIDEQSIVVAYLDNKKIITIKKIKPTKEALSQAFEK